MNPIDILGVDPGGAYRSAYDPRDHLYREVGFGSAPFDWNIGYDVEQDISTSLNLLGFKIPIKNQGQSGSCGGQAEGYLGAQISTFFDKKYEEKSAKFTYAPVAVPGGGSSGRALSDRAINIGWGSEALTTSYENGLPPSEYFMDRTQDITPAATQAAASDKALTYALVNLDIDSVAQAIRDNKGLRMGVVGSNNGTWLSPFPKPPIDGENHWYHWITQSKAKLINGKKFIGFANSWGTGCGENGWQWIGEDYFNQTLTNDEYGHTRPFFEARTYLFNSNPVPPTTFHHVFNTDLQFGMSGPEVQLLQTALQVDGEFPAAVKPTQYYGTITRGSVQAFQTKYSIALVGSPGYGRCGPLTRAKLNQLFGS